MDKMTDFIRNNKEMFDEEPVNGHKKRFLQKLKHKSFIKYYTYSAAAAFVAVVLAISLLIRNKHTQDFYQNNNVIYDKELYYAEIYYNNQIEKKLDSLRKITCSAKDTTLLNDILSDLKRLDNVRMQLTEDLRKTGYNPAVKSAIINNYRLKENLIDRIIKELNNKC